MKSKITVTFFLCICFFFNAWSQDSLQRKRIELKKVELHPTGLYGTDWYHIINTLKEYRSLIGGKPDFDLDKNTLIGVQNSTGGCSAPTVSHALYFSAADSSYTYEFKITTHGMCKPLYRVNDWFIVPKIADADKIKMHAIFLKD